MYGAGKKQQAGKAGFLALGVVAVFLALPLPDARAQDAGSLSRDILKALPFIEKEDAPEKQDVSRRKKTDDDAARRKTREDMLGDLPEEEILAQPIEVVLVSTSLLKEEIESLLQKKFQDTTHLRARDLEMAGSEMWALGLGQKRLLRVKFRVSPGTQQMGKSYLIAEVTEIAVREVKVVEEGSAPVREAVMKDIERNADALFYEGKIIDLEEVDRALMERLHLKDVRLRASIEPVSAESVDLKIAISALPPIGPSLLLQTDNAGDWSFGRNRVLGGAEWNNHFISGDALRFLGMKSMDLGGLDAGDGTAFGRAEYTAPLGEWGVRLTGWASGLHYHQVESVSGGTNANGEAIEVGAGMILPVYLGKASSLEWRADFVEKYTVDRVLETARTAEKHAHNGRVKAAFMASVDKLNAVQASVETTVGMMDLSPHRAAMQQDAAGPKVHGVFAKMEGEGKWLGRWEENSPFDFALGARGQWAANNLDSMEKFSLGGSGGLRAFASGEAAGDAGYRLNAELGYAVIPQLRASVFYDMGQIWKNMDAWTGSASPSSYVLQDAGVGATAFFEPVEASLVFAHQIGANPGLSADGLDSDNTAQRYRVWFSLTYRY